MPDPLRVFYNASAVPERPAGAGVYTLELGRALGSQPGVELTSWATTNPERGRRERFSWELLGRGPELAGFDVYHGPHMFTPKSRVPTVATVHDLTFFRLPQRYTFARKQYYRWLARTAKRAGRVIVPSAAVAADVVRYLGVAPAGIRVIQEAPRAGLRPAPEADVAAYRQRAGLEAPYLLCLGTAEPGKRAIDAIRAMPAVLAEAPGTMLALAGNRGRLSAALEREVAALGLAERVRFLGYVADEDLPALLTGASALVFPSLYEGFGLPPLEAMACGTPVVSTDAPAMSEVLRGAATLVPLRDPGAIARAAVRLLNESGFRQERTAVGFEFVRQFSWERAAEETVAVYREVAE